MLDLSEKEETDQPNPTTERRIKHHGGLNTHTKDVPGFDCRVNNQKEFEIMQCKRHSFIESVINVAIGYFVALLSQIAIFPMFNIHVTLKDNIWIGLWFTVISIIRSYILRRMFTRITETHIKEVQND